MVMKPLVLRGGRVLRTGDTRPACLDLVIGTDGRIAALTPPAPVPRGVRAIDPDALIPGSPARDAATSAVVWFTDHWGADPTSGGSALHIKPSSSGTPRGNASNGASWVLSLAKGL